LGVRPVVPKRAVLNHVRKLRSLVENLKPLTEPTEWSGYAEDNTYTNEARQRKAAFVAAAVERGRPAMVWDLGCNTGEFALLAAKHAQCVVAIDADPGVVNTLYERTRASASPVIPIVMDLMNPSPDQGWDQRERDGLDSRGPADLALALALVHHLRLRGNVPVEHIVRWLRRMGRSCVVEFVPRSDPTAQRLLAWREDIYDDFTEANFETALANEFRIEETCRLPGSGRVLFRAVAR
jgi:hypothetical protein